MSGKPSTPTRAEGARSRLPSLTGMRFIAAVMVFLFHGVLYAGLFADATAQGTLGAVVSGGGWAGVTFFFILSGFVLAWSSRSTDTVTRFWRRRIFKIFPNHLFATVIAFVLLVTVMGAALTGGAVAMNVLLLHSWVPDFQVLFAGNVVSWTLSCELLFYLAFPFIMPLVNRIRPERLWYWAGALVVAVWLVPSVAAAIPPAQALAAPVALPVIDMTMWQQWFVALFPPARLFEFVFGMVLARVVITGRAVPVSLGGAVAVAIAAYALTPLFPGEYRVAATMALPLGLVIAAARRSTSRGRAAGCRAAPWCSSVTSPSPSTSATGWSSTTATS
ncbi:acyltransferase family protein [Actinokineospora soli]|uniref:Acyltransferase family protein n=1 Tax=Actinokineospora soli TaxID=1048753 RepID=A0ABW2TK54_9PSEU